MRIINLILILLIFCIFVFAGNADVIEFKAKIGFTNDEDKIVTHEFLENGSKVLIIGEKNLQLWDVKNAKLLNSVSHELSQFAPRGFVSTYLLLGIPQALDWKPFVVEPHGKWIITVEKVGASENNSAIVRDLQTLKQLAVLDLPGVSTDYVAYDEQKNEIMTFGNDDLDTAFASWNIDDFSRKDLVSVKDYKWHQIIRDEKKILVGSGDTKFSWSAITNKQGDTLTLRDVKTGALEKQFSAENLKPDTTFQTTIVTPNENFLISKRDNRVFVWEIDGDGKPKFEISSPNPKNDFDLKKIVNQKFIVGKLDEQIRIYDVAGNGEPIFALAPQNPKEDLSFRQIVGGRFVVIKADNKIRVYDIQGKTTLKYELASDNPKDTMEFYGATKDGKYIVVRDDRKVSVYELAGGDKPLYEIVRDRDSERFNYVFFTEEKNLLAVSRTNRKEKKAPRTEFYDITTGKLKLTAPFAASFIAKFTPDGKYLYEQNIGSFYVWNVAANKFYTIGLDTETEQKYDPITMESTSGDTENTEYAKFSPDYRYILLYGDDVTAVFDAETGISVQALFDPEKVKYDKKNQIKKSGLGEAGWLDNGKYIYAFEPIKLFGSQRTISFWEVK